MKANIGSSDKLIRLGIAIVLIVLFYLEIITGTLGIIALVKQHNKYNGYS
jgi:hypothetical protein